MESSVGPDSVNGEGRKRRKRKVIKKIIKRRMEDGSFVPVEVVKTVIDRDGSRSITRHNPTNSKSLMSVHGTANSTHEDNEEISDI